MVLTNSASRSRNMVQTNNQPQAADFGSIFSSVAVTAYGARNRRQRGVYNIDFWSANRPKTTAGPNTGRSVTGTRGSAWNVRGTSAHSRLIDDVTFSIQGLARATAAELAANDAAADTGTIAVGRSDINNVPLGKIAIDKMNAAIQLLTNDSTGLLKQNNVTAADTANKRDEFIDNLGGNLTLDKNNYELIDYTNSNVSTVSIYDIRDNNDNLQNQYIQVKSFVNSIISDFNQSLFPDTEFGDANAAVNAAFEAEMAYKNAYDNEIATNNAKTAAEATLATANSRLY